MEDAHQTVSYEDATVDEIRTIQCEQAVAAQTRPETDGDCSRCVGSLPINTFVACSSD